VQKQEMNIQKTYMKFFFATFLFSVREIIILPIIIIFITYITLLHYIRKINVCYGISNYRLLLINQKKISLYN